jgi:hypothetical protein
MNMDVFSDTAPCSLVDADNFIIKVWLYGPLKRRQISTKLLAATFQKIRIWPRDLQQIIAVINVPENSSRELFQCLVCSLF